MKNTMKKLMIATLGLAVAGSVFGAPQVFDYKASVKHMYLKEVKIKTSGFSGIVYQKYAKSASLKGYLIMDADGVTSPTITANELSPSQAKAFDYGRNRGFLVVQNSKAEAKVRAPKILPAVLDAKWINTSFKKDQAKVTSGLAEGTLFVGGDSVAPLRPQLDLIKDVVTERGAAPAAPALMTPGMSAYADYVWTSAYLFGQYNGPNWFTVNGACPFGKFEEMWDANLPSDLQINWMQRALNNYFHDTWMNGAGIGKYTRPKESGDLCCGLVPGRDGYILDTLTGNLKGGLFLCTENGVIAKTGDNYSSSPVSYQWYRGMAWEDQFNCKRINDTSVGGPGGQPSAFDPDAWQNDMWNDGAVEQATTDVIYGSWSIKWSRKWFNDKTGDLEQSLTEAENRAIVPAVDTLPLWSAIKGAALKLNKKAKIYDGEEIHAKAVRDRFDLPLVTPKFATYYGLK